MKNFETFTQAQMEILQTANDGVKGTENYHIYYCEAYCRRKNGTWFFVGWGLPLTQTGYFKTVKGDTFVYSEDGQKRWKLSSACIDLLNVA
jgi:hypothetical protein